MFRIGVVELSLVIVAERILPRAAKGAKKGVMDGTGIECLTKR